MKYVFFLLLFIQLCEARCEETYQKYLNTISSVVFCVFGIGGLLLRRHSSCFYLLMILYIYTGLGSIVHHYDVNVEWAHASDLISLYLLGSVSLFFMLNNIDCSNTQYRSIYPIFQLLSFLSIGLGHSSLILFQIGKVERNDVFLFVVITITIVQIMSFIYVYKFLSHAYNKKVLHNICVAFMWSITILTISSILWRIDDKSTTCDFPFHALWHMGIALVLFNAINLSVIVRFIIAKDCNSNDIFNLKTYLLGSLAIVFISRKPILLTPHIRQQRQQRHRRTSSEPPLQLRRIFAGQRYIIDRKVNNN